MMDQDVADEEVRAPGPAQRHDIDADGDSFALLQALWRRHPDICRVAPRTRGNEALVVHDADAVERVLLTNRGNYTKGAGLERVRLLLGNGLIVSEGEVWARQRRLMQPAFHGQVMRGFAAMMEQQNLELIERWSGVAARGESIDVTQELSDVTLNIVLRALFGPDLDRLIEAEGGNPFELLTRESRRDMPFAIKFRGLTRFVRQVVGWRRQEGRVETDFLSMLMAARDKDSGEPMSERALLDEIVTLIVAGHETTASALNWTWYLLSQHPEVEAAVHAAVDRSPAGADCVEQVLQESLRLYPPVWLFSRRALAADRLGDQAVAPGTDIFICPYLLHRHPAHWQRPEVFDPGRFAADRAAGRHRCAYLPFAAGPRFCIGAGFAMAEMTLHVSLVARRFRLEFAGDAPPEPAFQINLRTRDPVLMRPLER